MASLSVDVPACFELSASSAFLSGFKPGRGTADPDGDTLVLTFRLDRTWEPVAVALTQRGRTLDGEVAGNADRGAVASQVKRALGLDVDVDEWPRLGERDAVLGRLQAAFPGFLPVSFTSPWDAGVWGLLAQRTSMDQAVRLRAGLAAEAGDSLTLDGRALQVAPSPAQILALGASRVVPDEKLRRLQALARAALEGTLDAHRLRAMDVEAALASLEAIHGVGAWTAQHILMRGAALPDALPDAEPRVLRGFGLAYGLEAPTPAQYRSASERWRPYRMWVAILLARWLGLHGAWRSTDDDRRTRGRRMPGPRG